MVCSLLCRTTRSSSLMDSISHRGGMSLWPSICGGSWRVEWLISPSFYPTGETWMPRAQRAAFSLTNDQSLPCFYSKTHTGTHTIPAANNTAIWICICRITQLTCALKYTIKIFILRCTKVIQDRIFSRANNYTELLNE